MAEIAHVDLIEQELLDKPGTSHRSPVPGAGRLASGRRWPRSPPGWRQVGFPHNVETSGVEQEDWQNGWRKYYHPMEIGSRLAVVPSWQQYGTDRVQLTLDGPGLAPAAMGPPACAGGAGSALVQGRAGADIGTGSGIWPLLP